LLDFRSIREGLGRIGADLSSRKGVKRCLDIKKDRENTCRSVHSLNPATSSVFIIMYISNYASIGSRFEILTNPFITDATYKNGLNVAVLLRFSRPRYVNEYAGGGWANAVGGAEIGGGGSGAMYGGTVVVDKQASDDVSGGAYFTCANAKSKDNKLEQKSDNFR
ncbi:autotransporter outer membrane beta-barrel domain-containing protein, partial [Campylobacter coli]